MLFITAKSTLNRQLKKFNHFISNMHHWVAFIIMLSLCGCIHEANEQVIAEANLQSAESVYRVGATMQKSGDYMTAMNMYKQALSLDKNYTPALIGLAQVARAQRQTTDTILMLEQAAVTEPNNIDIKIELAKLYIVTNRSHESELILKSAIRREENINIMNALGVALDMQEKHDEAQNYYTRALLMDPHHCGVLSNLGLSLALSGHYQESLKHLEALLKRDHPSMRDRHNAALVYVLSGRPDRAKKLYKFELDASQMSNNIKFIDIIKKRMNQTLDTDQSKTETSMLSQSSSLTK